MKYYDEIGREFIFDSKTVAFNKEDGSLIGVYYTDEYGWQFRTRGTLFAEAKLVSGTSYRDAILNTLGFGQMMSFQDWAYYNLDEAYTYIFEFVSPENRIVTRYQNPEMVLLAIRNNDLGVYVPHIKLSDNVAEMKDNGAENIRAVEYFEFGSIEDILKAAGSLTDLKEGYVVMDGNGNRTKIKSPAYVAVHHIRGEGLTPRRIAELVLSGEQEEYLTYFPEDRPQIEPYAFAQEAILFELLERWNQVKHIESQKEFALAIADVTLKPILFSLRKEPDKGLRTVWDEAKLSYRTEALIAFVKNMKKGN